MVCCEICNKEFPFAWKLRRHLARKKPCAPIANDSEFNRILPSKSNILPSNNRILPSDVKLHKCKYCQKEYKRIAVHEKICKLKDDEVWQLEQQCKVPHKKQNNPNQCNFCNKVLCRSWNLPRHLEKCQEKIKYKESLEAKLKQIQPSVNNTTINNNNNNSQNANTINNINIQVLGNENMDHVTIQKIEKILHNILQVKYPGDNNLYKLSAETVADVHKLIREDDANKNIVIPHERREIALIKRNNSGFVKDDMGEVLDNGFRNTSKKLYNAMKDLETAKKTQRIHKCVESFSKKGFRGHPEMPKNSTYVHRREDVNNAKRKFKLANMYEKVNDEKEISITQNIEKTDTSDIEDWLSS